MEQSVFEVEQDEVSLSEKTLWKPGRPQCWTCSVFKARLTSTVDLEQILTFYAYSPMET